MSKKSFSHFAQLFAILAVMLPSAFRASAETIEVKVENFNFKPAQITIKPGDTVHWRWAGSGHSTTSGANCTENKTWNSGVISSGSEFSHTFTVPGDYPYFCKPHCAFGMTGRITVSEASPTTPGNTLDNPISSPINQGSITARLVSVATGLTAPNFGTFAPGDKQRLFVTDQIGIIWAIDLKTGEKLKFGDISSFLIPVGIGGPGTYDERGLLGLAFHPRYRTNGLIYTYTSEPALNNPDFSTQPTGVSPNHQSVIREWRVALPKQSSSFIDLDSSRIVLRIDQPQFNHNGGGLAFDKDGLLYISMGDGGNADDEGDGHSLQGNGQDKRNLLGKILRINPNFRTSINGQYGIPKSNPFYPKGKKAKGGQAGCNDGVCDEIYAYGFRNPFRISFDSGKTKLYTADTGQNSIEEVDVVRAGGNYGWPIKEGTFCFDGKGNKPGVVTDNPSCGQGSLIDPNAQYDHDEGKAIIGGFVYRGKVLRQLKGHYVFGDYAKTFNNDGRLFYLKKANIAGNKKSEILEMQLTDPSTLGISLLGFGQDSTGEIYVLGNQTGIPSGQTGSVFKLIQ